MNFLAGLLLMYLDDEAAAFSCLVMLMEDRGLRKFYGVDMALLQVGRQLYIALHYMVGKLSRDELCAAEHTAMALLQVRGRGAWFRGWLGNGCVCEEAG